MVEKRMGQRKWGKRDYQKLSFRVRVNYNSNDIIQFFNGFFCKHRRQAEKNSCQNTPYRSPFEFEGAKKKKKIQPSLPNRVRDTTYKPLQSGDVPLHHNNFNNLQYFIIIFSDRLAAKSFAPTKGYEPGTFH